MQTIRFCSFCTFAALVATASLVRGDDEAALKQIRELYAKIDQGKPVKTTEIKFEVEGDPMEGTITRFTYEGGLSAIKLSYVAGDHGGADEHFYFTGDKLFFIFVKDQSWSFGPDSTNEKPTSIDRLTETRYYLQEGRSLRALSRTTQGSDAEKLPALIAKEENKEIEPDERLQLLLGRAKAMRTVATGKEAAAFFEKEGS
jgi:hypothetical protein